MRRAANPWDRFYRQHDAPWRGERSLADLQAALGAATPGRRILELGCGNGKTLRPLRMAGYDVVGVDIAWHALRRLGEGVLADAAALPFHEASFETVLDLHCTGHLGPRGRAAALAEACRVVRPGGHIVVERLGRGDLRATQGTPVAGDVAARAVADGRRTHFEDEAGLCAAVEDAGFGVVDSATVTWRQRLGATAARRESVRVVGRRGAAG